MSNSVTFWGVLLYLVGTSLIGLWAAKNVKSVSEFFVAKKNLGVVTIIALLFGELIAGAGTVGNAADAFKFGLSSVWMNWGMVIGCVLVVLFMVNFYRSMNSMSVPEAYNARFDRKCRMVMMFITCIVYFIIFAMQPVAGAAIFAPMLGVDKTIVVWILGGLFVVLCVTGGLRGIAWMNVVHSIAMYVGLGVVAVVAVNKAGGLSHIKATLPPEFFSLGQPDLLTVTAWAVGTGLSLLAGATLAAAIFGSGDVGSAKKGVIWAGILIIPFALFPALIGLSAKVALPGINAQTALFSMAASCGPVISILASVGVVAAILSTAPALLLITVTTLTRDFYKVFIRPNATDAEELIFSRVATVVMGASAVYFGLSATSLLSQILGAFQIRSTAGVVLLIALIWKKVNSNAAFWSMLSGGLVASYWHFAGKPFGLEPLWPSLIVGLPVLVVLTLVSKKEISSGYERVQEAIMMGAKN